MKLSLSWIFDHIEEPYDTVSIDTIVRALNESTAEVESWSFVNLDLSQLALAQITAILSDTIEVYIPERDYTVHMPMRSDVQEGYYTLIRLNITTIPLHAMWARLKDLGGSKEHLLPLVHVHEGINARNWRQSMEVQDYTIEIDNKSITHRPDLWSHRGFARELATIHNWRLKSIDDMIAQVDIQEFSGFASTVSKTTPTLTVHEKNGCHRLAATYVSTVSWAPSRIPMMARLCRIDAKAVNALVDLTNYVMFDIGQPMHAFDAAHIRDGQLSVRRAKHGESLRLLDGDCITLDQTDLVIADSTQPVSLAGIMGGNATSITPDTTTLLLESGCFDPVTIRQTATKYKKRTDASMRFEKDLDPYQVTTAIQRYLYLLHEQNITHTYDASLVVIGPRPDTITIEVTHTFLEQRLGSSIPTTFVINTLEGLGFSVVIRESSDHIGYRLTVPSYRATKDIQTPEDIVEEVGRLWGYKRINTQFPLHASSPTDLGWVYQQRTIKKNIQLCLRMHEIYSYAFFDESWLRLLEWQPTDAIEAQQPVSGNWKRLVTSLIPNLLKAVHDNAEHHQSLRFFEQARTWTKKSTITESQVTSGIFYDAQPGGDFYSYKTELASFFSYSHLPVSWQPANTLSYPWLVPEQTAHIIYRDTIIGIYGMIQETWRSKIAPSGSLAVFELDTCFLRTYKSALKYHPIPKYPDIQRDVSMFVPLHITADLISSTIRKVDQRIIAATLIDFFHKKEWGHRKSLTFSFIIRDPNKTLAGQEIDLLCTSVAHALKALGAEIR